MLSTFSESWNQNYFAETVLDHLNGKYTCWCFAAKGLSSCWKQRRTKQRNVREPARQYCTGGSGGRHCKRTWSSQVALNERNATLSLCTIKKCSLDIPILKCNKSLFFWLHFKLYKGFNITMMVAHSIAHYAMKLLLVVCHPSVLESHLDLKATWYLGAKSEKEGAECV